MTEHYKDKTWYIFGTVLDNDKNYVVADVTSVDTNGNIYLVDSDGGEYEMSVDKWRTLVDDGYILPASNVDETAWEVVLLLDIFQNADIFTEERPRRAAIELFRYAGE